MQQANLSTQTLEREKVDKINMTSSEIRGVADQCMLIWMENVVPLLKLILRQ